VQPALQVQLFVRGGRRAIEFYKTAFGAIERYRFGGDDAHDDAIAQLSVGDSWFWVEDGSPADGNFSPRDLGGASERLLLIVDDPARVLAQAIEAGAVERSALHDEHGWRLGRVDDPFGHRWEIGHPLGAWPPGGPSRPSEAGAGTGG
jgi:PhnB protein